MTRFKATGKAATRNDRSKRKCLDKDVEILTKGFLDSIKSKVVFLQRSQGKATINNKQQSIHDDFASLSLSPSFNLHTKEILRQLDVLDIISTLY